MNTIKRLSTALLLAGCVAGCASTTDAPAPTAPAPADPAPSAASSAHDASKPYECGKASYYADSLAGNATASGEAYEPGALTAAHKKLPFGTTVRVVRADTGGEVTVNVNDRGPFTPGRVIDLSRAAASEIGLIRAGVADVCLYVE
ncbi:MAG: septal ring lytic transglycosylase RlpA family protein [Parvularculaceae bacterium]